MDRSYISRVRLLWNTKLSENMGQATPLVYLFFVFNIYPRVFEVWEAVVGVRFEVLRMCQAQFQ